MPENVLPLSQSGQKELLGLAQTSRSVDWALTASCCGVELEQLIGARPSPSKSPKFPKLNGPQFKQISVSLLKEDFSILTTWADLSLSC
jgi:hypothetical protein